MPDLFRFKGALRLGVAPDGLALVRSGGRGRTGARLLAQVRTQGFDREALDRLLDAHGVAGQSLTVVLSDELVRLSRVAPPAGAMRLADLEAAAALRFQSLFGAGLQGWRIAADWDAARPFLAAALPQTLFDSLVQATGTRRCALVGVVPHFVAALNQYRRLRRPGAWFGLVHGGVLSVAAFDASGLAAVRTTPVPDGADQGWLAGHVAREALRLGLDQPERVQLCGPAPGTWAVGAGAAGCTLFEDAVDPSWPDSARLALSGAGS